MRTLWVSCFSVVVLVGMQMADAAADEYEGTGIVDYAGYAGCVQLENERTRVVLGPQCGGRVLEYSLDGKNCMYLDPEQDGWVYEPGKEEIDPSGGRLDIGPETSIPKHPDLWLGAWEAEITGARKARMVSVEDDATGVQLVRDFELDADSSKLTVTQTIRNISDDTKHWCHWSRTLARGHGICIVPLTPGSRFPNKYVMYEGRSQINYRPEDPNIRVTSEFLEVLSTPRNPKLGIDSYAGWLAYLGTNDVMFVKEFATYRERPYNEIAAITISIWYYRDVMCEIEPIGPMENIKPGGCASYTEQWWLIPHEFPARREQVKPSVVARVVAERTSDE